ncbi:MAG TPA: type IV secretory system conjugative DNA transfer family protein [Acidimicrobiales bacterium]|nr:type IV secretory system conjugative DNA transfer family protein [Acidimicrobiales bacterium]
MALPALPGALVVGAALVATAGRRLEPHRPPTTRPTGPGTGGGGPSVLAPTARGARWAAAADLRALRVRRAEPGRLVLGRPLVGWRSRRHLLAAEPLMSVAVVGPTQSGKTTALAVPAILGWEGPVVAASVKTDLVGDTLAWRQRLGRVACFDPGRATGLPAATWSPLPAAATYAGARRVAADLTEVAASSATTPDGEFWYATAAKLLAPLLYAAARTARPMADVLRWVDTQEVAEVAAILEEAGEPEALQAARASWQREERQRSSVYTTAETVLEPFAGTAGSGDGGVIDPAALLDGANTLYLCAPAHDQRRWRGLFAALVKEVLDRAFGTAGRAGRPLDPPLLVVLDEAAHLAPLAELDGLAATCAGHGVQLVTVWQDLAQVAARYGPRAATVLNNHRARLFLSAIADPGTLDHASHLVGDEEVLAPSVTRDASGTRSTTTAPLQRRLLPPDALRRLAPGTGVLVYGAVPPVRVRLLPWWEDPGLAARGRVGG